MAEVQANIVLTTSGGDASAAEIGKATSAIENVTSASSGMQHQFQERFQHIGLMLFAGDALRASGLGMETRAVIVGMNTALSAAAEGAGIASGGFLLLVTALVAVVGIGMKVVQHHKDEAEALAKVIDTQDKAYDGYQKEIEALNAIAEHSGGLSDALEKWRSADQKVADDIKANLLDSLGKEITALEKQRDGIQTSADMHAQFIKVLDAVKAATERLLTPFSAAISVVKQWASSLSSLIPLTMQHVALNDKQKQQYDELTAAIEKRRGQEELLANEGTIDAAKVAEATKKEYEDTERAWEQMADTISKGEKAQYDLITTLHKAEEEDQKKQLALQTEAHKKALDKQAAIAKQFTDQMAGDFGKAIAQMIVEGKSFSQEMTAAFTQMAEQIIEMIVKMIAEWLVFEALTGGMFGGAGASMGMKMFPQFAGGHALGGSTMATEPTLALFGEAGPETATFSPMSGGGPGSGGDGGGSGTTINANINITANGVNDPQALARMVGPALIQEIRGMGQLNFTRA